MKLKIYLAIIPVILLLILGGLNIYKKITWKEPTDGVTWAEKPQGLTAIKVEIGSQAYLNGINKGDILFEGQSILKASPHGIAELGIGRTFQNLALFQTMTVLDNVMVGGHCVSRSDLLSDALRLPWIRREQRRLR